MLFLASKKHSNTNPVRALHEPPSCPEHSPSCFFEARSARVPSALRARERSARECTALTPLLTLVLLAK